MGLSPTRSKLPQCTAAAASSKELEPSQDAYRLASPHLSLWMRAKSIPEFMCSHESD